MFSISAIESTSIKQLVEDSSSLRRNSAIYTHDYTRQVLAELQKHGINISQIYRETLRSMVNIFSNLFYVNGEGELARIRAILANPERTVAKMFKEDNITLPIISVLQVTSEDSDDRRRYIPQLTVETNWNVEKQRAERVVGLVPRPVNILYDVIVWTKYAQDMDEVCTQVRTLFNPSLDIITPFNDLTKGFILEEDNISSFDVGDQEDRVLRRVFSISVETYVPSPKFLITNTGKIERFNAELDLYKCFTASAIS